jgi:hypothetical protein
MVMKLIALAIVTAVGCSGCATLSAGGYTKQDDLAKIQAVTNAARAQGVQIVWINVPQKVVRASGS